jgi:cytochrome c oxidase subunit 2
MFKRTAIAMLLVVLPWMLSACNTPENYLGHTGGPAAARLASLGWFVLILFSITSVIVWLIIAWIPMRRRGTLDWHAPVDTEDGQSWILVGGVAVPFVVLAVLFGLSLATLRAYPMSHAEHSHSQSGTGPHIRVIGHQWWFSAEYLDAGDISSPTEIHIPAGQPVDLTLETRDVIHSFWIPKLHGKVDLVPGQINYIRIEAAEPGMYMGQCGEYCGMEHAHMRLAVIAHTPDDYERWLAKASAPAHQPDTDVARHGRAVFESAACPVCHTVRGTQAQGTVGPDLTHVGSRYAIAGGMLLNNRANLQAWVTQAQSLKPGSQMPNLTQFNGEDLQSLVTYLQSLK